VQKRQSSGKMSIIRANYNDDFHDRDKVIVTPEYTSYEPNGQSTEQVCSSRAFRFHSIHEDVLRLLNTKYGR
jgi:hypothetical protein